MVDQSGWSFVTVYLYCGRVWHHPVASLSPGKSTTGSGGSGVGGQQSSKVNHRLTLHLCTVLSSGQQIPSAHLCSSYIILWNTDYIHPCLCLVFPGLCQSIAWFLFTRVESSPCHLEPFWVRVKPLDVWVFPDWRVTRSTCPAPVR